MFKSPKLFFVGALLAMAAAVSAQSVNKYPGLGRDATPKEVAAWDIDVRADFKGLPAGSGSVAKGQDVWESKCASCHGVFGESGEVYSPLVGGTTAQDIKTGRVANLSGNTYPGRTTLMKVSTVSTLWDYINRAMPWTAPKSLSTEEVYAVTAFLLNLGGIVPDDYVLSNKNIAEVQQRMPNRNGMTKQHALWSGKEFGTASIKPDTKNVACMKDCAGVVKVTSAIPEHARNAHGNLAEQNRLVGAQRGADTTKSEANLGGIEPAKRAETMASAPQATAPIKPAAPKAEASGVDSQSAMVLAQKYSCTACHGVDKKIVGPSFQDISKKHAGKVDYLAGKIKSGGSGVWGAIPMPAQVLSVAEAKTLAEWLAGDVGKGMGK
jgi:S-disulfanyl-L-cysteine oxidoreductase SoxD